MYTTLIVTTINYQYSDLRLSQDETGRPILIWCNVAIIICRAVVEDSQRCQGEIIKHDSVNRAETRTPISQKTRVN